jgi:hypothetical protein
MALAAASDQILLLNVLRAKDHQPLQLGTLTSLNGALSVQGTAGFSIPFGSQPQNPTGNTFSPSLTGSTSPTFAFTPLNTQGFTLMALQPVSASYVQQQWVGGVSRELLLMLFVKEIDFPYIDPADPTNVHAVRYINNPDQPDQFNAFKKLIETLVTNKAELKSFDILDPVGPAFGLGAASDATKNASGVVTATVNQSAFSLVTGNNDGQYHFGNVDFAGGGTPEQGQLYRVYSGQVALCVSAANLKSTYPLPPLAPEEQKKINKGLATLPQINAGDMRVEMFVQGAGGGPTSTPGATPAKGATNATTPGGSSSQATMAALQAGRISSVVDDTGCGPAEIVSPAGSEQDFQNSSAHFVHLQWRSVSEVFDYLGAMLRYNQAKNAAWSYTEAPPSWVATGVDSPATVGGRQGAAGVAGSFTCSTRTLFQVSPGSDGAVTVERDGAYFSVPRSADSCDESLVVFSLMQPLVNLANTASTVTTSQPLQLLPLP